jgi:nitrite reductase/ring-hydroxylating ferredoxin subunit
MNTGEGCDRCGSNTTRRQFLQDCAGLGLALAILPGRAGTGSVVRYPIPAADGVTIDKQNDVILVRWQGAMYAFARSCPHQNTALTWLEKDTRFQCPKHKSRYQPDGTFISGRATRAMDRFVVKIEGAEVLVDLETLYHQDKHPQEWTGAMARISQHP